MPAKVKVLYPRFGFDLEWVSTLLNLLNLFFQKVFAGWERHLLTTLILHKQVFCTQLPGVLNRRCFRQAGGATSVDVDHGVIIPQILLSDGLRGLAGHLPHQVRHPLHVRDGVRCVELHVRGQLFSDLGYGQGGLLGEDDSLALDHSKCVKQGALKTFNCSVFSPLTLETFWIAVTCLRLLFIRAGVTPIIPRPIQ